MRPASARLAVLSACETAKRETRFLPDEAVGLPAGLLQAGVPGIVGTLWPVDDAAAALVVVRFFELHLGARDREPLGPAAALASAQRWLRGAGLDELEAQIARYPPLGRVAAIRDAAGAARQGSGHPFGSPLHWAPFLFVGA